jgi:hypothetical protein
MPEKEDKTNIKNGEYRVTGNSIPEKEDKTNNKNGESRVTGNTMPEKEDKTNILIFVLSSFWHSVACHSGFSILDICFIFFLWHSVACDSGFSILDIYFIFTNIKNGKSRVTGNTIPEEEDKTNILAHKT